MSQKASNNNKEIQGEENLWIKKRDEASSANRKAMKKLLCVTIMTLVFVAIEITGGIMANSIAILSDAAHLVSDVAGIGVSIIALQIAQRDSTSKYSYGYHRAEILGTMISLISIWIVTAYLVYQAIHRFLHYNDEKVEPIGQTMFIVACISLVFNLIQIKILHGGDQPLHAPGHSCGHEHGHGHAHGSDEEHEDEEHGHSHDHGHGHAHSDTTKSNSEKTDLNASTLSAPDNGKDNIEKDISSPLLECVDKEHGDHGHSHAGAHAHESHSLIDTTDQNHGHAHGAEVEVVDEKKKKKEAEAKKRRNINVQAAYLHILGDLLNSIGVVIASAFIYKWPQLWYLDPSCTLFFALIIMYTTRLTFYQCIQILMEATPDDVEVDEVQAAFEKVHNVVEVHDLHIWCLTQGKNSLTCHIKFKPESQDTQLQVLNALDAIARQKFGINHLTIQTEPEQRLPAIQSTEDADGIISEETTTSEFKPYCCGNDIHKY